MNNRPASSLGYQTPRRPSSHIWRVRSLTYLPLVSLQSYKESVGWRGFWGRNAQRGADGPQSGKSAMLRGFGSARSAKVRGFGGPFSRRPKTSCEVYGDTFGSERFRPQGDSPGHCSLIATRVWRLAHGGGRPGAPWSRADSDPTRALLSRARAAATAGPRRSDRRAKINVRVIGASSRRVAEPPVQRGRHRQQSTPESAQRNCDGVVRAATPRQTCCPRGACLPPRLVVRRGISSSPRRGGRCDLSNWSGGRELAGPRQTPCHRSHGLLLSIHR